MKTPEQQLNHLHTLRLSTEARSRMRAELSSYSDLHAVPARGSSAAPLSLPVFFAGFQSRMFAGLTAMLVLVLGVGGTAYASSDSLPGDTLYSIKVNVAEPVQTVLIPTDSGRATWHAILAERRLEEAAQLAARGSLETEVQGDLAVNFQEEVAAALEGADEIEEDGNAVEALSVRSDLEARVAAHNRILTVLASHYTRSPQADAATTASSLKSLLAVVETNQDSLVESRVALETSLSPQAIEEAPSATATLALDSGVAAKATIASDPIAAKIIPSPEVVAESAERTLETEAIFTRHAPLLAKFMPPATTTATTTVTGTASTTPANEPTDSKGKNEIDLED